MEALGSSESGHGTRSGMLEVFACDSAAYDVFAPTTPGQARSPMRASTSNVWLPVYASLSRGLLEFRHDPSLLRRTVAPARPRHQNNAVREVLLQQPLMGLSISGGRDYDCPVFVKQLPHEPSALLEGDVYEQDEILAVNGLRLQGNESHQDVADLVQSAAESNCIQLAVRLPRKTVEEQEAELIDEFNSSAQETARTIAIPLAGMSVWQDSEVVFARKECHLLSDEDRSGGRCFSLLGLCEPCCLFRARSEEDAGSWCSMLHNNIRHLLRDAKMQANAALQGNVTMSSIEHLAWMRTWLLPADPMTQVAHQSQHPGEDVRLIAIADTAVAIYDQRPAAWDDSVEEAAAADEHDPSRQLQMEKQIAFWSKPSIILPIVQSRVVDGDTRKPKTSGAKMEYVILRTGLEGGLERRLVASESHYDVLLWKTEFRKAWQTIPRTLLNVSFSALWHGQQCSIVLDKQDAISIFVEGSRQKLMTIPFDSIKRTTDTGLYRFNIWLDTQSCVTFKFEGSFKPFQCAFITYLAFYKSGIDQAAD